MAEKNTGTIDYGIDLGTTTSSIAKVDGNNSEVIQNTIDGKNYLSSAVYIDKKGRLFVGDKAKKKIGTDSKNAYAEFKTRMGTEHTYTFENTGKQMTPIELSAEILKELRRSVKTLNNKDLKAAVITIPADFNIPQNNATKEAAKLAGFEQVVLLQEPTAAAMAYGFNSSAEDEIWLIYDLGGGTFDVSIMMKNEEEIVNKINQGDNRLGGKLIDEDIVDKILAIVISQELKLTDFNRNNTKYRKQFAKLKRAAEQAKEDLSHHETTEIMIDSFMITSDGDAYDFEYEMSREELNSIMKPYVDRTINHCNKAMEGAKLSPEDISKIILVGGSTLSPYIRERLEEEYHIPLEYSINPTTVVAKGAAFYAGTLPYTGGAMVIDDPEERNLVNVTVNYDSVGKDQEFFVNGTISISNSSTDGYTIEFTNTKTNYSSGKIPVEDGYFDVDLKAEDLENNNEFEIKVYDANGDISELSPNSVNIINYKIGTHPGGQILSHTIGVGRKDDSFDPIANQGDRLPYHVDKTYKSSDLVRKGTDDKLIIPIYEGNRITASNNERIGEIIIRGHDIVRDLPAESEIELTFDMDKSLIVTTSIYVPFINYSTYTTIDGNITGEKVYVNDLISKFNEEKERYGKIQMEALQANNPEVNTILKQIQTENMIESIDKLLQDAKSGDDGALHIANDRIRDFKDILDQASDRLPQTTFGGSNKEIDKLIEMIEDKIDNASLENQQLFGQLKQMYQTALAENNQVLLENILMELQKIVFVPAGMFIEPVSVKVKNKKESYNINFNESDKNSDDAIVKDEDNVNKNV